MTPVVIGDVKTASGESKATGKAWTRWDIFDGNGDKLGATFDGGLGQRAIAAKGRKMEVTVEHGDKGDKVTAIEDYVEQQGGDGAVDWDAKERRGHARACLAIAENYVLKAAEWSETKPTREILRSAVLLEAVHLLEFVYRNSHDEPPFEVREVGGD